MILIENKIAGESGSNETYFYDDSTGKAKKETSTQNKTAEHILPKNDEPDALARSKPQGTTWTQKIKFLRKKK